MTPAIVIVEIIGWIGAVLVLAAYMLLSTERIASRSRAYQWMNVIGAVCFIVNSGWNGALPSATLNIIWMLIGLYALWNLQRARSSTSATPSKRE
jgi:hypothetical protein